MVNTRKISTTKNQKIQKEKDVVCSNNINAIKNLWVELLHYKKTHWVLLLSNQGIAIQALFFGT